MPKDESRTRQVEVAITTAKALNVSDEHVAKLFYPDDPAQVCALERDMRYERQMRAVRKRADLRPVVPCSVTPENWQRLSDEKEERRRARGYLTVE